MTSANALDPRPLVLNGIDGDTGQYLDAPLTVAEAAAIARGDAPDKGVARLSRVLQAQHFGFEDDARPEEVSEVGWGVVYHEQESQAVKDALKPLVQHRLAQVGDATLVKELTYRTGETRSTFLAKHQVTAGSVRPRKVPYYLLVVGSPELIPFDFGYLLDLEYAVGRLHFDTAAEYARYAQAVIDYETAATVAAGRDALFFGPRHPFDGATQLSHDRLLTPLLDGRPVSGNEGAKASVMVRCKFRDHRLLEANATRANLLDALRGGIGGRRPSILFTASHGVGWKKPNDAKQVPFQGALLCQDFPGLGQIARHQYLAADDVPADAQVHGLIAFLFACYGAGTPKFNRFSYVPGEAAPQMATQPFVASLPKRLLAHPAGGALACVGHVERAWGWSIESAGAAQLVPYENLLSRLMKGIRIGHAVRDFGERYATLTADLARILDPDGGNPNIDPDELVSMWRERNDAESFVVLGDPAVCLRAAEQQ